VLQQLPVLLFSDPCPIRCTSHSLIGPRELPLSSTNLLHAPCIRDAHA
jgi:hypothetical protein